MTFRHLIIPIMVVNSVGLRTAGASDKELLDLVRQGHSAALHSMTSFYCGVTFPNGSNMTRLPVAIPAAIEYWRRGDSVRVRERYGGEVVDIATEAGELRSTGPKDG